MERWKTSEQQIRQNTYCKMSGGFSKIAAEKGGNDKIPVLHMSVGVPCFGFSFSNCRMDKCVKTNFHRGEEMSKVL